jgi:hypothetical protein
MENTLQKVDTNQLDEVVKNSGLAIIEGEEIKGSYLPFLNQLAEIQSQANKINFENPTMLDEEIAGKLRKATVKVRTGAETLKDDRNRMNLLKQKLEVASYKLIEASCKLTEEVFVNVEKAREIAEKKRRAELKVVRDNEAIPYSEFIPFGIDLGSLDEAGYLNLLNGAKLQYNAKIEAEKKADAERIERERIEAERLENQRLENIRLKKEAEEREIQIAKERADAIAKQKAIEEKARIEQEKAEKELEAKKQLRIKRSEEMRPYIIFIRDYNKMIDLPEMEYQKELADQKIAKKLQDEYDQKEREKAAEIQRKQQAESERLLLAERKLAAVIEAKNRKDEDEKAEKERMEKERIASEKKAAAAPDRDKIINAVNNCMFDLSIGSLKSEQMQSIANTINAKFNGFKNWAIDQVNNL